MHPTLLEWLASFDKSCQEHAHEPTTLYNHLVQLGVEKPDSASIAPRSGKAVGCDCAEILGEDARNIARCLEDLKTCYQWIGNSYHDPAEKAKRIDEYVTRKNDYITKCRENIALYTSLHNNHAEYNRRARESIKARGLLAKVRLVCLRDLRGPTKTYDSDPAKIYTGEMIYCRIALKSYGEDLKTFLVANPTGWV